MASVCMRCGKPVLKDGQMCTKTDGQPWPCREEGEAAGSILVDGLIVRVGDNYGAPVMNLKDPYAQEKPKKKRPPTATCG